MILPLEIYSGNDYLGVVQADTNTPWKKIFSAYFFTLVVYFIQQVIIASLAFKL